MINYLGRCLKCGTNLFDTPDFESLSGGGEVKHITCVHCDTRHNITIADGGIVYKVAGRKKYHKTVEHNVG